MLTRSIPFKPERRANGSSSSTTTGSTMNAGTPDSVDSSNPMHAARLDACVPNTGSCRSLTIASSTRYVPEGSGRNSPPLQAIAERLATATPVSYTHLRAHETRHDLVCRLLLEKKKKKKKKK